MRPWITLATADAPGGDGPLALLQRDTEYVIRVRGVELMSSRRHGSEAEMAHHASAALGRRGARALVGGLGFGYTLQAGKDLLGPAGSVVVAEISAAVIDWNRRLVGHLAGHPLADARVSVEHVDVRTYLASAATASFDAILMDVDNGPSPVTAASNGLLWNPAGMAGLARVLRPGGTLVVWSSNPDPSFARRLTAAGLSVTTREARAAGGRPGEPGRGARHTLFVAVG